jgi:protein arginine N-methyltransferase 1
MEKFRQAIAAAVRPGDVVVDLGCGFAPLGLLCLEAGAARVYGMDRTDAIEIARESAERAGFGDRYICIRDHSFRAELPEKADVVICDHVGYFGFEYGVVEIMRDARRRMLKPGGRVIPGQITLKVAGVNAAKCREKAFAWTAPAMPAQFRWLEDYAVNSKHTHFYAPEELLTSEGTLGEIDLAAENPDHFRFDAELVAQTDGALDGLGGWFNCAIAAGICMTNSPLADARINRDQVFLAFDRPMSITAGDVIHVTLALRHDVTMIAWTAHNTANGERRRQSTWASQILSASDHTVTATRPAALGRTGTASRAVLALIDGKRSPREIEDIILADHPDLLPSESEIRKFVQSELTRSAQ